MERNLPSPPVKLRRDNQERTAAFHYDRRVTEAPRAQRLLMRPDGKA